jgi:hypothetical protein
MFKALLNQYLKLWDWYMEVPPSYLIVFGILMWYISGSIVFGSPWLLLFYIIAHLCTTGVFCYSMNKCSKKHEQLKALKNIK